ncbi:type I restriction endonuclease subunit R [Treponema sp.]|uniref:type I restriction endonuclease subunit R n=1 Tax=Treponema sp. TaxID=166 RepID=UPI0025D918D8|nr:type I restriction endonuclease subunit R [Treponema sp.]MCR5217509.1 type I restriction endonuclease subunit R [Treponema sp.]
MSSYTEESYENALIELFTDTLGYDHVYGPDIDRDFRSPLYDSVLEDSIRRLNPKAIPAAIDEALLKLRNFENAELKKKNALFMEYLQNGIEVSYSLNGETKSDIIYLADFSNPANNSFIVANQWTFIENSNKRPDILLFLNGLPVCLFELKSPSREQTDASEAYTQIRNYMQEIPSMFIYNCICVMSDQLTSKAGTITSGEDRFMEWKTKDGNMESKAFADFTTFFEGIFQKARLLDIIKNFICFNNDGINSYKILAGYHQYFAVRKTVERTKLAVTGDGKIGVFWHTQGSGKSLSMVFYAHLLQQTIDSPTIVVITDRNDLDNQLYSQFSNCKDFLRQDPVQAESREHLKQLLEGRKANGIIFTTMQKFEENDEPLSQRKNIIVMADEAHRGQYGLTEKIKTSKDENGNLLARRTIGTARIIRDSLPNASYIGFTGTPISRQDRSTIEVFGDYIDIYDMTQAVMDGATRPVYYESRVIKLKLDDKVLAQIDAEYDFLAQNADEEVIEKSKHELGKMEEVLGADQTIDSLVNDILNHYENERQYLYTGKAMIVAYNRKIAMKIFNRILELRPSWAGTSSQVTINNKTITVPGDDARIAVVMTESNKDPEEWRAIIGNKNRKQELATRFKDNDSPLKIAIVVDMWLTGFDVPSLATMYVYKPMESYNLMQAIARVNRVFKDKEGGLVVDYVGIANALKQAMNDYTIRDRENYGEMDVAKRAFPKFQEKLEICQNLFFGYDHSDFYENSELKRGMAITGAINFIMAPDKEEEKQSFIKEALMLKQSLSLCSSMVQEKMRMEAAFFEAVRVPIMRLMYNPSNKKFSLKEINDRINELLKQTVKSDGVINLFSDVGEEFNLFDPKFLADVAKMKNKNLAVEMLKKLINEQVKVYRRTNLVKSEKFSELVQQTLNRYLNGMLTNEEVIQEMLNLAKEMAAASAEGNKLGLTDEELAFYDALTKPEAVKDFYSNEELIALTKELTETLRKNKTIDWQKKESARAKMRLIVKRLLKKYKYPPEGQEAALKTVISQCEMWTDSLSDFEDDKSYTLTDNQKDLMVAEEYSE